MIPQHPAIQLKPVSSGACALLWVFAGRVGGGPAGAQSWTSEHQALTHDYGQ